MKKIIRSFLVGILSVSLGIPLGLAVTEDTTANLPPGTETEAAAISGNLQESTVPVSESPVTLGSGIGEKAPGPSSETSPVGTETIQPLSQEAAPAAMGTVEPVAAGSETKPLTSGAAAAETTSSTTASAGTPPSESAKPPLPGAASPQAAADAETQKLPPVEGRKIQYVTLSNPGKDVFVKTTGGQWIPAQDGMVILPGDEVRTAKGSSVEVILEGEKVGRIEVTGGSQMQLTEASLNPATGDKQTLLALAVGKIMVKAQKLTGDSQFEVRTPSAIAGVRGTLFEVEVEGTLEPME